MSPSLKVSKPNSLNSCDKLIMQVIPFSIVETVVPRAAACSHYQQAFQQAFKIDCFTTLKAKAIFLMQFKIYFFPIF